MLVLTAFHIKTEGYLIGWTYKVSAAAENACPSYAAIFRFNGNSFKRVTKPFRLNGAITQQTNGLKTQFVANVTTLVFYEDVVVVYSFEADACNGSVVHFREFNDRPTVLSEDLYVLKNTAQYAIMKLPQSAVNGHPDNIPAFDETALTTNYTADITPHIAGK